MNPLSNAISNHLNFQDTQFYAVINSHIHHVATSEETSKYQVSWTSEHADAGAQTYDVHIYDEEGISAYHKAVEGHSSSPHTAAKPLFTVNHYHQGVSKKTPFSAETFMLVAGLGAFYYATVLKGQFKS
jgi:predicted dithiol-disulfide oxidoreductase (DUF899 family)